MNKRQLLLDLIHTEAAPASVPAAFFLHFDPAYHTGQAAIQRHLEYFRHTGMELLKIQFEQRVQPTVRSATDWLHLQPLSESFFEPTIEVVRGLVRAVGSEALIILTLYSPFMWMVRIAKGQDVGAHFQQDPAAAAAGLEVMTASVRNLARASRRAGIDGFYASTQGGEAERLPDRAIYRDHIKPSDLAVWAEIESCAFNVLHICDYEAPYDDLSDFFEYPGQVVNASLQVGSRCLRPREASAMFGRPFMGGLERLGVVATGPPEAIRREVESVLAEAPERFILAADCTVPADTPWDNLKTAIDAAHAARGGR